MGISSFTTGFTKSNANAYGSATGGSSSSITIGGKATTLLTFTTSGTLTVTKDGVFDFCVVAGGARGTPGGERNNSVGGGGGGGGVFISRPIYVTAGTYAVGVAGASSGAGNPSNVGDIVIVPGGGYSYGGQDASITQRQPADGSACGSGGSGSFTTGGTGIAGFGYAGGNYASGNNGGGGGGAGAVGSNGVGNSAGGAGGAGLDISAFLGQSAGTTRRGPGGGGGGATVGGAGGAGQAGGAGGAGAGTGTAGTANTGGGGGGAHNQNVSSGNGGSGVVYVRFTT